MLLAHLPSPGEAAPLAPRAKPAAPPTPRPHATLLAAAAAVLVAVTIILAVPRAHPREPPAPTPAQATALLPATRHENASHLFSSWPSCPRDDGDDDAPKTHVVGGCGETCGSSFSVSSLLACTDIRSQGCHFYSCEKQWGRHCTFHAPKLEPRKLCPGDTLRISAVPVRKLRDVKFKTTLSVSDPPTAPSRTDVVFLLSATGSMKQAVTKLRASIIPVLQAFSTAIPNDPAFGLAIFRDEYYGAAAFQTLQHVTTRRESVATALKPVLPVGGGDLCDANLPALERVASDDAVGWRDGARRVVVYIADHPGHEPSCDTASKPITRATAIAALNKAGVEVFALDLGAINGPPSPFACPRAEPLRGGQATDIARATGGRVVVQREQADVVAALDKIADMLSFSTGVAVKDSMCTDVLDIEYDPELPVRKVWGLWARELKLMVSVSAKKAVCVVGGTFRCDIEFVSGPRSLGKIHIDVTDVLGCKK